MRKHGWQLPYHPLQVVAIAVFLALAFAFYVFFVPFVGKKVFEHVVLGLYTPLVASVFFLYIWCAAADPADPGVSKSKKRNMGNAKDSQTKETGAEGCGSVSSKKEAASVRSADKPQSQYDSAIANHSGEGQQSDVKESARCCSNPLCLCLLGCFTFLCRGSCSNEKSSEQQSSEDGMFYCNLCKVEVFKYSKHCRVCDKCVDAFDHHCRWLNNCIGRKNYRRFFVLMVSALLMLVLQWVIGIIVLVRCILEKKQYNADIASKLGSSFSLTPFIVVVASCTVLAMIATLPLAQLFFFHVLLIKKGLSTYDYIIALKEQEQQGLGVQQSPQQSPLSSVTGFSSVSSFNTFNRGAWCTPPRLFLENQFDVIPPEIVSGKSAIIDEYPKKKHTGTVKINPWTLARLNAEEVSKAAAQARRKSKILRPVVRQEPVLGQETDSSFGSGSGQMALRMDRKRGSKRSRIPNELPLGPLAKMSATGIGSELAPEKSNLAPLQLEARSAFHPNRAMSSAGIVASSPDSSLDSPDIHPFRLSSSGAEEAHGMASHGVPVTGNQKGIQLSRSTSDGYEASGGEDSDRVPPRIVHRSSNWSSLILNSSRGGDTADILRASSTSVLRINNGRPV